MNALVGAPMARGLSNLTCPKAPNTNNVKPKGKLNHDTRMHIDTFAAIPKIELNFVRVQGVRYRLMPHSCGGAGCFRQVIDILHCVLDSSTYWNPFNLPSS